MIKIRHNIIKVKTNVEMEAAKTRQINNAQNGAGVIPSEDDTSEWDGGCLTDFSENE